MTSGGFWMEKAYGVGEESFCVLFNLDVLLAIVLALKYDLKWEKNEFDIF